MKQEKQKFFFVLLSLRNASSVLVIRLPLSPIRETSAVTQAVADLSPMMPTVICKRCRTKALVVLPTII